VSCVTEESSVSAIDDPGAAEPERVKTMCATRSPGAALLSVKGTGFVDS